MRPNPSASGAAADRTQAAGPAAVYAERLRQQEALAASTARLDFRLGAAKLALVLAWLLLAWLAVIGHYFSAQWLWLPTVVLIALFLAHDRTVRARTRADRLVTFYQGGVARLEDRWTGTGTAGDEFLDPHHAYSADLDLFGHGGLFELICRAATRMGQQRIAAWMLTPAPPAEILRRQEQVRLLAPNIELRERVAAVAADLNQSLNPARLQAWAVEPTRLCSVLGRIAAAAVGMLTVGLGIYGLASWSFTPFFVCVGFEWLVLMRTRAMYEPALADRGGNGAGLRLFAGVLECIPEPGPGAAGGPKALRQLAQLSDWVEACGSMMGKVLDFTVLYSLQLAFAADGWRRRHGAKIQAWLEAVAEFEALLSLSALAYERPDDPFPEVRAGATPEFCAERLRHPLLARAVSVPNSVQLDSATRILLVSGSNMSGKSTLMRTVGLNAVLAQMGAPVQAERLRMTPLAVGTRLRTADSLQLGRSGFYAEILRLRQIVALAQGPLPLLFLFDELLEGTNSHDRVQGAQGLIRALLEAPTLGLITTHDLALTQVAEGDPRVRNVHFEDQIQDQDVRFDHRLRPGVVTRSNALALMRIIGLEV